MYEHYDADNETGGHTKTIQVLSEYSNTLVFNDLIF